MIEAGEGPPMLQRGREQVSLGRGQAAQPASMRHRSVIAVHAFNLR